MFIINFLRAWVADSLIQLGWAIAPPHYMANLLEGLPPDE